MTEPNTAAHGGHWQARLQDAIDGVLDSAVQTEVSARIESCATCRDEHAKLLSLHRRLQHQFAASPKLSEEFSARILASIDEQEHVRRAQAKQRAELEFRERMRAFGLDWRELWQRHTGSIIAALTVVVALAASLGSLWELLRERLNDSVASMPDVPGPLMLPLAALATSVSLSAAIIWFLRTKLR